MKIFIIAAFAALAVAAPFEKRGGDPNSKKGVSYDKGAEGAIGALAKGPTWAYNWGGSSPKTAFEFVPMCWGTKCNNAEILGSMKAGSKWVMGYNEPDMCGSGGSCHTPKDAYDNWGDDMFTMRNAGAKLVCPAVTSNESPTGPAGASGLDWLEQWAHTSGPGGNSPAQFSCSAQALHWYGAPGKSGADQGDLFIAYVKHANQRVNQIFGKPMDLWITEFAPLPVGDANVLKQFLDKVIPFLDGADYVTRYAPFKGVTMISGGQPNAAGSAFIGDH